jgi:hypothetical protein
MLLQTLLDFPEPPLDFSTLQIKSDQLARRTAPRISQRRQVASRLTADLTVD